MNRTGRSIITYLLVGANVIVWLILSLGGNTESAQYMYQLGAMYPGAAVSGEWYRLFTSMFLHFGIVHLANNMLVLFALGREVEAAVGHIRYLIIYLIAGLGGNILSMAVMLSTGDYAVSAGASGAIFGLMGAMLAVILVHRGRYRQYTVKRVLLMVALCLYFGVTSQGVDNACHVGGLISGFIACFVLYGIPWLVRRGLRR